MDMQKRVTLDGFRVRVGPTEHFVKKNLLDTLQLTQEKEKSSVAQCSTG